MKELYTLSLVEGGSTKPFESAIEQGMQKDIAHFEKEIGKLRTGRANPAMAEDLIVSCYGASMRMKEVAALTTPEAQLLVIQPWDKNLIPEIEKTISQSELGINPTNDGSVIRLVMPTMTSERRAELVKVLNKKLEDCRIAIRSVRETGKKIIKDAEKSKAISEDYSRRLSDILQKITDSYTGKVEAISKKKEAEIKSI